MKIKISYSEAEEQGAALVVTAVKRLFQVKVKSTPLRDGYLHTYLEVKRP